MPEGGLELSSPPGFRNFQTLLTQGTHRTQALHTLGTHTKLRETVSLADALQTRSHLVEPIIFGAHSRMTKTQQVHDATRNTLPSGGNGSDRPREG
jgi:hypothetical protein